MSKKDFKGGLDSLLQPTTATEPEVKTPTKKGRPKTSTRQITKSSQENTKEGETRATFIVKEHLLEAVKNIAYWDRTMIKDIVNTALQDYIDTYTAKNKGLKNRPTK
jgi:hypothetical protein